ncbi:hypothetical protein [Streptomyces sp. NRRL F-5650]|uniref:hypothetical protein n=1 Tax=Streptomyces sp. NRRL F-5650 TaxID=1463868 RepID=UPI0004CA852A|nr:hypothetical protein [Streptomyces sp. NRRL F-5650]
MIKRTRTRTRTHRPALATLTALTALTTAACGPAHDGPNATPSAPLPTAADGTGGTAPDTCTDGNCEITVTRPVTLHFPGPDGITRATLSVTEVAPNKIEYEVKSGNNRSETGASGPGQGCLTHLRDDGSANSCGALRPTRPSPQPGAVVIQATTGTDGRALLHIVSP